MLRLTVTTPDKSVVKELNYISNIQPMVRQMVQMVCKHLRKVRN